MPHGKGEPILRRSGNWSRVDLITAWVELFEPYPATKVRKLSRAVALLTHSFLDVSLGYVPDGSRGRTPEAELCKFLYELIESGAELLTCNKDILVAFKEAREKARTDFALSTASFGLSLWAGYSAFWTTVAVSSSTSIAPLAAWTLGDIIGLALLEVPVITTTTMTTTFWWCPPVAVAAGIGAVGFGVLAWKKKRETESHNDKVKYYEANKCIIGTSTYFRRDKLTLLIVRNYVSVAYGLAIIPRNFCNGFIAQIRRSQMR